MLAAGDPGVTQQRVVTEYGYEAARASTGEMSGGRGGGIERGCGGGVNARLDSGGEARDMSRRRDR